MGEPDSFERRGDIVRWLKRGDNSLANKLANVGWVEKRAPGKREKGMGAEDAPENRS